MSHQERSAWASGVIAVLGGVAASRSGAGPW